MRRLGFAAFLARVANEYLEDKEKGEERRARCNRLALEQARRKAGTRKIDVPRFRSPTTVGLQQMDGPGALMRLRAKVEILWASSDFSWVLFGPPKEKGKEHMWDARYEPRYAFEKLLRKSNAWLYGGAVRQVRSRLSPCRVLQHFGPRVCGRSVALYGSHPPQILQMRSRLLAARPSMVTAGRRSRFGA